MYIALSWRPQDEQESAAVQTEILTAIATLRFNDIFVPFLGHITSRLNSTHSRDILRLRDRLNASSLSFSFLLYKVRRGNRIFHSDDFPRGFLVPAAGPPNAPVVGVNNLFNAGSISQSANLPGDILSRISDG